MNGTRSFLFRADLVYWIMIGLMAIAIALALATRLGGWL